MMMTSKRNEEIELIAIYTKVTLGEYALYCTSHDIQLMRAHLNFILENTEIISRSNGASNVCTTFVKHSL